MDLNYSAEDRAFGDKTREERRQFLPLVIVTSNREKELPAAFLRRCLYYFIPFPNQDELGAILECHHQQELTPLFRVALRHFWELRHTPALQWRKAPSKRSELQNPPPINF